LVKHKEDQGEEFGTWTDNISRLMYHGVMKSIIQLVDIPDSVIDYGGANGLIKQFIPHAVTVDRDTSKNPDIVADILTFKNNYKLTVIRYVLHYLNDYELLQLFDNLKVRSVLVIQFVNDDLKSKYYNSQNEPHKYFRSTQQLEKLLPDYPCIYTKSYRITEQFYKNRLGPGNYKPHTETIKAYYGE